MPEEIHGKDKAPPPPKKGPGGPRYAAEVRGDSTDELEAAALTEAAPMFAEGAKLSVDRDYVMRRNPDPGGGKKAVATITVKQIGK